VRKPSGTQSEVIEPSPDAPRLDADFVGTVAPLVTAEDAARPTYRQLRAQRNKRYALIALVCVLIGGYLLGARYYTSHFFPHTSLNGQDVSGLNKAAVVALFDAQADEYVLDVSLEDAAFSIHAADIGYVRGNEAMVSEALSRKDPLLWPLEVVKLHTYNGYASVNFDERALSSLVERVASDYNSAHLDSSRVYVSFDNADGTYHLAGKAQGNLMDADKMQSALAAAIFMHESAVELSEDACMREATLDDYTDLAGVAEKINAVRAGSLALTHDDATIYTFTRSLRRWVWIEDNQIAVAEDSIAASLKAFVAPLCTSSDLINDYTLDVDALTNTVSEQLRQGNVDAIEVPLVATKNASGLSRDAAWEKSGWDSERGRYIDVDLDVQYARFFDADGTCIWESPIVSGDALTGRNTPEGTYTINSNKTTKTVLVGADEDGDEKPDYETPVDYWIPFIDNLIAFHDASWRPKFGGQEYRWDGSHGCINLPPAKAEELYDLTQVGDVVWVHS
jgi:lipoprotein-anchoring transpeptidase ErfK/SrfK